MASRIFNVAGDSTGAKSNDGAVSGGGTYKSTGGYGSGQEVAVSTTQTKHMAKSLKVTGSSEVYGAYACVYESVSWGTALYLRGYYYLTGSAVPAGTQPTLMLVTVPSVTSLQISFDSARTAFIGLGLGNESTGQTLPLNAWFRLEADLAEGSAAAVRAFTGTNVEGTSATWTANTVDSLPASGSSLGVYFGVYGLGGDASAAPYYINQFGWSDDPMGPHTAAATTSKRGIGIARY